MKRFYVHYWNNFANTYNLYWAEIPEQIEKAEAKGYERISRKNAEKLCADENCRRKNDYNFSGYASTVIYPIDYDYEYSYDWMNDKRVYKDKYIIEYV